jgi:hypothetical protein
MAAKKKGDKKVDDGLNIDFGIGDLGLNGLFECIEKLVDLTSELEKKRKTTNRLQNDVNKLIVGFREEIEGEREIKTVRNTKANPLKIAPIRY